MIWLVALFCLFLSAGSTALATTAPSITAAHFALAAQYSKEHGGLVLYVRQGGRLLFDDYYGGFSARTPHKIYSGTKSFIAVTALIAQQDGLLTLDEPASKTLTEWQHDRRRSITIAQLLNQTSGLNPDGEPIDSADDQFLAPLRISLIATPGTQFHYGAVNYQAFGEILKRKLQPLGKTPEGYLTDRLLDPLDIEPYEWKHDKAGNPLFHAGMFLTAEQWARFGQFVSDGGNYKGKQIVDKKLFPQLFIGTKANPAYGLGFWLNAAPPSPRHQKLIDLQPAIDGDQIDPSGPRDIITCLGSYRQRLYVIPSLDLVVVRFAYQTPFSDGDFLSRLLNGHPQPDAHTH